MLVDIQTPLGRATAEQVSVSLLHPETLASDRRLVSWRFTLLSEQPQSEVLAFHPGEDVAAHLRYWAKCLSPDGQAAHDDLCDRLAEQAREYARRQNDDLPS